MAKKKIRREDKPGFYQLKFDVKVCLIKNGYPPQYNSEVFRKVIEQVENFKENN